MLAKNPLIHNDNLIVLQRIEQEEETKNDNY